MALDVVSVCAQAAEQDTAQGLSLGLAILFAVYILLDSALAAWVIVRKSREAEHTSVGQVVAGTVHVGYM